MFGTI
jgi:hypothetical protein